MEKNNWKLWNLQFVIVFDKINEDFKDIPQKLKSIFEGDVMMLPIPESAPKEIPRITMTSSDNFRIEISRERISLFFNNPETSPYEYSKIKNELNKKNKKIIEQLNFTTSWIGLVLSSINKNETANSNVKKLLNSDQKFFELLTENEDLFFRYHKVNKVLIKGVNYEGDYNIEFGSNLRRLSDNKQIGNILTLDMNTSKTTIGSFDYEIAESFFDEVFLEQDSVLTNL